jgi:hypothetical protein
LIVLWKVGGLLGKLCFGKYVCVFERRRGSY